MAGKTQRAVTVIPPTINPKTHQQLHKPAKRKVAGYARVSTASDEQFTSYAAQVDYYTQYIQSREDWEYVAVYADEGISGLSTKAREGFNRMIADALAGKIDLIVTKSVSRFARNTVDGLSIIRKLKEHGVEVYFEKENIYTFDGKGEVLLTIMSSLAQEESRSISENVTWGQRKRFADGKITLPYKHFLGYEKGADGFPKIVPAEAELVRRIYDMYLSGHGYTSIAKALTEEGVPTPGGKEIWRPRTIQSILSNEKYKGDALLQKTFTVDFLSKKTKVNEGEVPQYYVENSHEAIISPELFERVQDEMRRRKALGVKYCSASIYSCKIICEDCGAFYGPKVWNSTGKYRRTIWQCNHKFRGEVKCATPHLTEEEIQSKFLEAFNRLLDDKDRIIEDCRTMQNVLADTSELDTKLDNLSQEAEVVSMLIQRTVSDNAALAQDQTAYQTRYNELVARYNGIQDQYDQLQAKRSEREKKAEEIGMFMFDLMERDGVLQNFDSRLWSEMVENATVSSSGNMTFLFKNGTQIAVAL